MSVIVAVPVPSSKMESVSTRGSRPVIVSSCWPVFCIIIIFVSLRGL